MVRLHVVALSLWLGLLLLTFNLCADAPTYCTFTENSSFWLSYIEGSTPSLCIIKYK
jgi:hypothetical protein